ncbi:MAG: type II secretion system protein GspG [Planctomycetota bacterium]|jgi:general secretion pathway protein G|nr:type II secretion system protein GspG [Blastopirellula sp.]
MVQNRPFAQVELATAEEQQTATASTVQTRAAGLFPAFGQAPAFGQGRALRRRRGFTLMELLLVMAILVIMASMVTFAFMNFQTNANKDAALSQISTLATACRMYKMNVGIFPNTLNDLITMPTGMTQNQWRGPYLDAQTLPMDPWQQPYVLGANNGERVIISSNGPDRQAGTPDDITNNR